MNNMISQEEIDALLKKGIPSKKEGLDDIEIDIVKEFANISMSKISTTLTSILGNEVNIRDPKVSMIKIEKVKKDILKPTILINTDFQDGLIGSTVILLENMTALSISDIVMGGDGNIEDDSVSESEKEAALEVVKQAIGDIVYTINSMTNYGVTNSKPEIIHVDPEKEFNVYNLKEDDDVCRIETHISVGEKLQGTIIQLYKKNTINRIIEGIKNPVVIIEKEDEKINTTTKKDNITKKNDNAEVLQNRHNTDLNRKDSPQNLDLLMDVPLEFSVVLGKSKKKIKDVLTFGSGSIIELNKHADELLEVYVNGKLIAQGEVVVVDENFGIRITNILSRENRLKGL